LHQKWALAAALNAPAAAAGVITRAERHIFRCTHVINKNLCSHMSHVTTTTTTQGGRKPNRCVRLWRRHHQSSHHSHGMNASLVRAPAGLRMIALLAFAF